MEDTAHDLQRVERPPKEEVESRSTRQKGQHVKSDMPSWRFVGFVVEGDEARHHIG